MGPHFPRAGAGLAVAVLLAGCGSTVAASQRVADGQGGALGPAPGAASVAVDGVTSAPTGPAAAVAGRAGASSASGGPATAGLPSQVTGTGGATTRGGLSAAPGVTSSAIYLGFHIANNAGAANAALGASGVTRGDQKQDVQAVIDDVNKRGGVAGRKLVPVFYTYDATDTRSVDTLGQEACQHLTQDNKVFASLGMLTENELSCLERAGVWVIAEQLKAAADRETFRQHPYYVELGSPNFDRDFTEWIPSLARRGWFAPWDATNGTAAAATGTTKVGVLTIEYPSLRRSVTHTLEPALRAAGYPPMTIYLPYPASNADLGAFSAAISNAVLKFRSAGVDHVLVTDSGGTVSLLFSNQAESQHYRPRYGGDSNNGWQALRDAGAFQAVQLNGAMGVGFTPALDLSQTDNPDDGPYSNAARKRCVKLYRDANISFSDTNAKGVGMLTCGSIWALQTVVGRITGTITRAAALAAVEGLGSTLTTPNSLGQTFGPGRHDGISGYYDWQWDASKGRFAYVGPLRRF